MLSARSHDPAEFHRDRIPQLLQANGDIAAHAAAGLPALTLRIGVQAWTYTFIDGHLAVVDGASSDGIDVTINVDGWSAYVENLLTVPGLLLSGEVTVAGKDMLTLSHWDLGLRALYSGIPAYDPDRVPLTDEHGAPIDLTRTFTLNHDDAEIAAHLDAVGFVRIRGVFDDAEVRALNDEVDRLSAAAVDGDDRSWWSDHEGDRILNRLVYTEERSRLIRDLSTDTRVVRLSRIHQDDLRISTDRMEGLCVLIKPPGELHGLANIPWHQDCGMGGHSVMCPAVGIGIQLTGADARQSQFVGIAGSHGMTAHPFLSDEELSRMPLVAVDTEPGDVTLHVCDVIHASPPPEGDGGRRTLYVSAFPPALFDLVGEGEAFNDLVRGRDVGAEDLAAADVSPT